MLKLPACNIFVVQVNFLSAQSIMTETFVNQHNLFPWNRLCCTKLPKAKYVEALDGTCLNIEELQLTLNGNRPAECDTVIFLKFC